MNTKTKTACLTAALLTLLALAAALHAHNQPLRQYEAERAAIRDGHAVEVRP